ncbi:LacI family DNA-binding transcriptional regulator [Nonomuraea muscovyensis]|uniref:LacI family DNA-binding transcriptional regulator n=1 Tax=Nonomuraea muscovyensis TaxID=1124761 RepID=UPI0033C0F55D|nr:transcriptional regulator, LacI family [Nonomuraea muscovyensis]
MQDPDDLLDQSQPPAPTVGDVAEAAGVSRMTVSNVINNPHRVSEATRKRVEDTIAMLGYQPNRAARALRVQASRLIGCRIEPFGEDSLASINDRFLHALAEAGREADHYLLMFTADNPEEEVEACRKLFRTSGVDGFVLYGINYGDLRPKGLQDLGAPFVAFGRNQPEPAHPWIDVDNRSGTAAAVDHLVALGHRRVAFLGWAAGDQVGDYRAEGWQAAMQSHGLLADCRDLDIRAEDTTGSSARACFDLLDRDEPPTAIVAASDTIAVGAVQAAQSRGLAVGSDLAVVGFDDTPTARVLHISSVRQPLELVARAIVHELLNLLPGTPATRDGEHNRRRDDAHPPAGRLLKPNLVIRASSAAPARQA